LAECIQSSCQNIKKITQTHTHNTAARGAAATQL